jgi:hypothetical protein
MFGGAIAVAAAHNKVLVSLSFDVAAPMATVAKVLVIVPLPPSLSVISLLAPSQRYNMIEEEEACQL